MTAAVAQASTGLKLGWRGQIVGAGLGARLANSIKPEVFPKAGASLNAAAVVWSKAPVIIGAHDTGPLIRARNGLWLAIATPAAAKALGGKRITPAGWERRTGLRLGFVFRRSEPSLLVAPANKGQPLVPMFLLVPPVKLPKRLDLARDAELAAWNDAHYTSRPLK